MKNLLKVFTGTLILSLLFSGCKKDEEETVNFMQVGDVNCTLADGNIIYSGSTIIDETTIYVYNFILVSKGITLSRSGTGTPVYDGDGVLVFISLYSSGSPRPANGDDYVYHEWSLNHNALSSGYYYLSYAATKDAGKAFTNGTVTVSGSNNVYTINYEGTDESGTEITLQFSGELNYYDGSGWIKK
jgi:hypothetical protein